MATITTKARRSDQTTISAVAEAIIALITRVPPLQMRVAPFNVYPVGLPVIADRKIKAAVARRKLQGPRNLFFAAPFRLVFSTATTMIAAVALAAALSSLAQAGSPAISRTQSYEVPVFATQIGTQDVIQSKPFTFSTLNLRYGSSAYAHRVLVSADSVFGLANNLYQGETAHHELDAGYKGSYAIMNGVDYTCANSAFCIFLPHDAGNFGALFTQFGSISGESFNISFRNRTVSSDPNQWFVLQNYAATIRFIVYLTNPLPHIGTCVDAASAMKLNEIKLGIKAANAAYDLPKKCSPRPTDGTQVCAEVPVPAGLSILGGNAEGPLAYRRWKSDYQARAFTQSDDPNTIYIAARGTNSFKDMKANFGIGTGTPTQLLRDYVSEFAAYVRDVAADPQNVGKRIVLTGHSLGGFVATIVGAASGFDTVTFNSPGAQGLVNSFSSETGLVKDLLAGANVTVSDQFGPYNQIVNIINTYDEVVGNNPILSHVGQQVLIDTDPVGSALHNTSVVYTDPRLGVALTDVSGNGHSLYHNHAIGTLLGPIEREGASIIGVRDLNLNCGSPAQPTEKDVSNALLQPNTSQVALSSLGIADHATAVREKVAPLEQPIWSKSFDPVSVGPSETIRYIDPPYGDLYDISITGTGVNIESIVLPQIDGLDLGLWIYKKEADKWLPVGFAKSLEEFRIPGGALEVAIAGIKKFAQVDPSRGIYFGIRFSGAGTVTPMVRIFETSAMVSGSSTTVIASVNSGANGGSVPKSFLSHGESRDAPGNAKVYGQSMTLTSIVSGTAPGGAVTFYDGAAILCSGVPLASDARPWISMVEAQATCVVTDLAIGDHHFTAVYSGDGNNAGSTAPSISQFVGNSLDVDASGASSRYDALTDGLLIFRYMLGATGDGLTVGALGSTANRIDPDLIKAYLDAIRQTLDVDGNGRVDALSDGLILLRYLFGLRGDALVAGLADPKGLRPTAADIQPYIQALMP